MAEIKIKTSQLADYLAKNRDKDLAIQGQNGGVEKYIRGDKGLIGNLALGIVDPFVNVGRAGAGAIDKLSGNKIAGGQILSGEEKKNFGRFALQNAAGVAGNLVGGSGIGGAIAAGAGQALQQQDITKDINPEDLLKGAAIGGVTGLALKGAGKLFNKGEGAVQKVVGEGEQQADNILTKTGAKISKAGESQEFGNFQRSLGAKIKDQTVLPEFKRLGLTAAKDAEDLATRADSIIADQGSKIRPAIEQLDQKGIKLAGDDILGGLKSEINSPNILSSVKKNIQPVIDDIESFVQQNGGELTPSQAYDLKQAVGGIKAKFGSSAADESIAQQYQKVYNGLNDKIDGLLSENGFDNFRQINKDVSTAFNALDYAGKSGAKSIAGRPINLLDAVTAAGGLAGGGPVGMAAAAGGSKLLQSRAVEDLVAKGMKGTGNLLTKLGNSQVPDAIANSGIGRAVGQVASSGVVQNQLPNILSKIGSSKSDFEPTQQALESKLGNLSAGLQNLGGQTTPQIDNSGERISTYNQLIQRGVKPADAKAYVDINFPEAAKDKQLSATDKKTMSQAKQGVSSIQSIASILDSDPTSLNQLYLPPLLRNGTGKSLSAAVDKAAEMFGRIQSGGAISKEEEQRFKEALPGATDDPNTRAYKLQSLFTQFSDVLGS